MSGAPRRRGSSASGGSSRGGSGGGGSEPAHSNLGPKAAAPHVNVAAYGTHLKPAREAPLPPFAGGLTKRRLLLLAAVGTIAVVAIVGGTAGGLAVKKARASKASLDHDYCAALPGPAQPYCKDYYSVAGQKRFAAASLWEKMSSITCEAGGAARERQQLLGSSSAHRRRF